MKRSMILLSAAGMLGAKAPAPLKANSLAQELLWDRKDDAGQPVPAGAYKVSVSLGLKGELDRFIEWEPPTVTRRSVRGLAADAGGGRSGGASGADGRAQRAHGRAGAARRSPTPSTSG